MTHTLTEYTCEPLATGWRYRLAGTMRTFSVVPFEGLWRATNGARSALGLSPDHAATTYLEAL